MKIKALKAVSIRDSETGDLTSIAHGAITNVDDTLGESLISDELAEAYDGVASFKKLVDRSITRLTADMLDGVTSIGASAFVNCNSLESIEIPSSVTSIGVSAFYGCSSLTSLTIPKNVTSIGSNSFVSTGIKKAKFENLPSTSYIFSDTGLEDLIILKTGKIYSGLFSSISTLKNLTLEEGSIETGGFDSCSSLANVKLGEGVTNIGQGAFYSCFSLTTVTIRAKTPPTLGYGAFPNRNFTIYVPAESLETYKAATNWSNYASKMQAIPS